MQFTYEPVGAFARMLAKIAYGFAVVAVGCDLTKIEQVHVLPAILGQSTDVGRWVGGSGGDEPSAVSDLHYVSLALNGDEIVVRVRLFARYNAPEYLVAVGRMPNEMSLSEVGLPEGAHWVY